MLTISDPTRVAPHSDATLTGSALMIMLAVLLLGDLIFIGLHLVHVLTELLNSSRWSIERDRGFGEMFQYLKFGVICVGLAHLFAKTRMLVLLGWIAVFVFLLLDDAARIHERFGLGIVAWAQIPGIGGLRGRDVGELLFALLVVALMMPMLAFGYLRGPHPAKAISGDLAVLSAALMACAVGVDVVHRVLADTSVNTVAGIIEDGGEMLVLSVTCFYVTQWVTAGALQLESPVPFRPGAKLLALARRHRRLARAA